MITTHTTPRPATAEQHDWIRALSEDTGEQLILPPTYIAAERQIERLFLVLDAIKHENLLRCAGH